MIQPYCEHKLNRDECEAIAIWLYAMNLPVDALRDYTLVKKTKVTQPPETRIRL